MDNPLDKDIIKSIDAVDLVLGSLAKPLIEGVVSGVVGNGNLVSGAVKLAGAMGIAKYGGNNRLSKGLAIGAGMDGAEDVIIGIRAKMGGKSPQATSAGVF